MTPQLTYQILLFVQFGHLFHHRISKRHISYAEVLTALILCIPPSFITDSWALIAMSAHVILALTQVIGSLFIKRLSPDWQRTSS
jgi:hypothetical protein